MSILSVCKDTKSRAQDKMNSFIFHAETEYLRHKVAKIRKVERRAKRIPFFFYAETRYLRYAVAKISIISVKTQNMTAFFLLCFTIFISFWRIFCFLL